MRRESKQRARALQLLYLMDAGGAGSPDGAANGLSRLTGPEPELLDGAMALVDGVRRELDRLDELAEGATENWRPERLALIEKNILRLGIHELLEGVTPAKVVIDEAVWLAQRFGGGRAPAFVNGVLDRIARDLGRL
jgi:N utilization substance protein B